jgi:hypothetical protein
MTCPKLTAQSNASYGRAMSHQILYFHTGTAVRVEVHARAVDAGVAVDLLFNPPQDACAIVAASADEAADLIEPKILEHLAEQRATLQRIVIRHDLAPLTYRQLGRFAVPLMPEAEPST